MLRFSSHHSSLQCLILWWVKISLEHTSIHLHQSQLLVASAVLGTFPTSLESACFGPLFDQVLGVVEHVTSKYKCDLLVLSDGILLDICELINLDVRAGKRVMQLLSFLRQLAELFPPLVHGLLQS